VARLAILGDSNSVEVIRDCWVPKLNRTLTTLEPGRWQIRDYARFGASITWAARSNPRIARKLSGESQIAEVLSTVPKIDVVILAFGTNDFLLQRRAPPEIVDGYRTAIERLEGAGARVLLAYTPPCYAGAHVGMRAVPACDRLQIKALNDLLDAEFSDVPKIDFWSWVTPADLMPDQIHFTPHGQDKRRDAALVVLRPAAVAPWWSPSRAWGSVKQRLGFGTTGVQRGLILSAVLGCVPGRTGSASAADGRVRGSCPQRHYVR
jgi:lysophospholipase L1-like esterase